MPSKTYNLLAVGAPLLCIVPDDSELASMVSKYKNGGCFQPEQVKEIAAFIEDLAENKDKRNLMAGHSIEAAKKYTYSNARLYV